MQERPIQPNSGERDALRGVAAGLRRREATESSDLSLCYTARSRLRRKQSSGAPLVFYASDPTMAFAMPETMLITTFATKALPKDSMKMPSSKRLVVIQAAK